MWVYLLQHLTYHDSQSTPLSSEHGNLHALLVISLCVQKIALIYEGSIIRNLDKREEHLTRGGNSVDFSTECKHVQ